MRRPLAIKLPNLRTQTVVKVAFVRSRQKVNCQFVSVFRNSLFNPDSVHGLLGNSTINFLVPYPFFYLSSLIKTRFSQFLCRKYHFVSLRWLR